MARTITSSFQKLKENLEISDRQEATVSTRQGGVREVIEAGIIVDPNFETVI